MHGMKSLAFVALAGICFIATPPKTEAQISINIGGAPNCPYGYYDYAPYNCAPVGYYGPEWFQGGAFIGAGKWFHGPANFHGKVDNHFDPQHGFKGPMPRAGERADPSKHVDAAHFKGNEDHDGRGGKR
jgi:hypothetical protein